MNTMRTFSVRLDEDTFRKLEDALGDKTKADYVREVLIAHLNASPENRREPSENLTKENADLRTELENKDNIIRIMNERVKDLQMHNGFLVSEFHRIMNINERLLLPAPEPKKWWQFWK